MSNPFQRSHPGRGIYEALMGAVEQRDSADVMSWTAREAEVVFSKACEIAPAYALRAPTMEMVLKAEREGRGHCNYATMWISELLKGMQGKAADNVQ